MLSHPGRPQGFAMYNSVERLLVPSPARREPNNDSHMATHSRAITLLKLSNPGRSL